MVDAEEAQRHAEWWDRTAAYLRRRAGRFPPDFWPSERDELLDQARGADAAAREWRARARDTARQEPASARPCP